MMNFEDFNRNIDELELSVHIYADLRAANIRTIGELVQKKEADLLKTRNIGRKSVNEIKASLSSKGLHLGMDFDSLN